jgi:hypothetical protein
VAATGTSFARVGLAVCQEQVVPGTKLSVQGLRFTPITKEVARARGQAQGAGRLLFVRLCATQSAARTRPRWLSFGLGDEAFFPVPRRISGRVPDFRSLEDFGSLSCYESHDAPTTRNPLFLLRLFGLFLLR